MKFSHIVLLKFKKDTTEQGIKQCFDNLGALKNVVPGLESFKWGEYASTEELNPEGFTYGFEMIFKDKEARDEYLKNPSHIKVAKTIIEKLENKGALVFDFAYESKSPATPRTICDGIEAILKSKETTPSLLSAAAEKLEELQQKISKDPQQYTKRWTPGFSETNQSIELPPTKLLEQIKNLSNQINQEINTLTATAKILQN